MNPVELGRIEGGYSTTLWRQPWHFRICLGRCQGGSRGACTFDMIIRGQRVFDCSTDDEEFISKLRASSEDPDRLSDLCWSWIRSRITMEVLLELIGSVQDEARREGREGLQQEIGRLLGIRQ